MISINGEVVEKIDVETLLQHYYNGVSIEGAELYMKLPMEVALEPAPPIFGAFDNVPLIDLVFAGGDTKNIGRKKETQDYIVFLLTNEIGNNTQAEPLHDDALRMWFDTFLPRGATVATRSGYETL